MKVSYSTPSGRLHFEFDATTEKEAFARVASIQEVFEEPSCGKCGSDATRCEVREFESNKYYKLLCNDCGATMDFGQHKDAARGLFAKRKDDNGSRMPNRGWYVYGETDAAPATSPATALPAPTSPPAIAGESPAIRNVRAALVKCPGLAELNAYLGNAELAAMKNGEKAAAWQLIQTHAAAKGFAYDEHARRFKAK